MDYDIFLSGINIINSYELNNINDMYNYINNILNKYDFMLNEDNGWKRTIDNYVAEWIFHNWCYNHHIMRSHSKDVFLDREFKTFRGKIEKVIYYFIERRLKKKYEQC